MREGTRMSLRTTLFAVSILLAAAAHSPACSICDPNFQQRPTLRQSARQAKFIVLGSVTSSRLDGDRGVAEFSIEHVIQADPGLGKQRALTLPAYVPVDPKNPPKFLLFGDFINGKLDILRSPQVKGDGVVGYLHEALKIEDRDRLKVLQFCFKNLDSVDSDVAADAFHELAKATDIELARVGQTLNADKIRKLLKDPATPAERLGIFAYLLGACGGKDDADLLATMIARGDERSGAALSGLLSGLIELKPDRGWETTVAILRDPKRHYSDKLAALGTLRFYHACKAEAFRKDIVRGLVAVVEQGDMADMAVEDLRRWHWWELTKLIVAQYGKSSHAAPLVKRSILRYALCCPDPAAIAFVKERRAAEPAAIKQVEESLEFEKPIPPKKNP
jgi:hypothetical protein